MAQSTNGWIAVTRHENHNTLVNDEVRVGASLHDSTGWLYIDVKQDGIYTCLVLDRGRVLMSAVGANQDDAYQRTRQAMELAGICRTDAQRARKERSL